MAFCLILNVKENPNCFAIRALDKTVLSRFCNIYKIQHTCVYLNVHIHI